MQNSQLEELLIDLRRLWRQYLDLIDTMSSAGKPLKSPMSSMLDTWWSGVKGSAAPDIEELFEPLVQHARVLFRLTDRLIQSQSQSDDEVTDFNQLFKEQLHIFGESLDNSKRLNTEIATPLSHLLNLWNESAGGIMGLSHDQLADWLASLDGEEFDSLSKFEALFHLPASHLLHKEQKLTLELIRALTDYQSSFNEYVIFVSRVTAGAVEDLQEKVVLWNDDQADRTTRDFYAEWLISCESVYARSVGTTEYGELQSRLINHAVNVKLTRQQLIDQAASLLGLPNRKEQNQLVRALDLLRRENRRLNAGTMPDCPPDQSDEPSPSEDNQAPAIKLEPAATRTVKKKSTKKTTKKKTTRKKKTTSTKVTSKPAS